MGSTPFPPFINRQLTPKYGAGMDRGTRKRTGNTFGHTMVGTLDGTDAYFRLPWVHAATDWGIGGALDGERDGVIYRWVDIASDMIPWASGPWRAPGYADGAGYVETFGVYGINANADSIELSGQVSTPMTVKQWQSYVWLLAAIHHAGGQSADELNWHMHHREICQPGYKDCPFPRVHKHTKDYLKAVAVVMRSYERGEIREDTASIAGLAVPLPLAQGPRPTPAPVPADAPVFVPFPKPRLAELWNCSERQYGNTTARILYQYREGTRLWFDGYYNGQEVGGDRRWFVVDSDARGRIHSSGIRLWLPDNPDKAPRFPAAMRANFPKEISNAVGAGEHDFSW